MNLKNALENFIIKGLLFLNLKLINFFFKNGKNKEGFRHIYIYKYTTLIII
jgi:hypothetical protein